MSNSTQTNQPRGSSVSKVTYQPDDDSVNGNKTSCKTRVDPNTGQEIFLPCKGKATFKKRPGYWYKKSQSLPNVLFYNADLSDAAVRLLCALNALPESWTIVQSDMRERLGWGRDKMRNAIKECENSGYMQVTRTRGEDGLFTISNYEFDLEPVYLKESLPHTEDQCAEDQGTEKHPLPCSLGQEPCSKRQQQQEDDVVVFSDSDSDQEKEKPWLWMTNLVSTRDEEVLKRWHRDCPDRERLEGLIRYACQEGNEIDNPIGWITSAIKGKWQIPDSSPQIRNNTFNFNKLKKSHPELKHWEVQEDIVIHKFSRRRIELDQTWEKFYNQLKSALMDG